MGRDGGPLKVFVSYRRDDDSPRAMNVRLIIEGALNRPDRPAAVEVFQDVRQRPGVRWPDEVRARLKDADVVLAVVGPTWLGARDEFERRRIDQPDDWVRQELESALQADKAVFPLVFGGRPPQAEALPPSLRELAARQMVIVRDEHSDHDLQPLLLEIKRRIEPSAAQASTRPSHEGELPYPDPPLAVAPAALGEDDLRRALDEMLPGWRVVTSPLPEDAAVAREELYKEFRFADFAHAIRFMADMVPIIERVNHHPRWENIYRTLRVWLSTWDIGHRVSYADVMLAQAFESSSRSAAQAP